MAHSAIIAGITLLIVLACDDSDTVGSRYVARDSAGVLILEYAEFFDSGITQWSVAEEPLLVIGKEAGDDPFLFSKVRSAMPLANGGIAVADGRSMEIRFFSSEGMHLFSAGG